MRRRLASPVPPFDVVPSHVVEAAKRAFLARSGCVEGRIPGGPMEVTLDLMCLPPSHSSRTG
jgi:hypothetical protein